MSLSRIYAAAHKWLASLSKTQCDALLVVAMIPPVYTLLVGSDAFERFYEFSRTHEDWEIDEMIALLIVTGLAGSIFALRRLFELRKEVIRRRQAEDEAHNLARHDALTGLPNRRYFLDEAAREIAGLSPERECAIFLVDLDFFKPVNDLYGHDVGDQVLCEAAKRLSLATEGDGLVARLGGDEFGMLINAPRGEDVPERIARRVVHDVSQPFSLATRSIKLSVSVGATVVDAKTRSQSGDSNKTNDAIEISQHLRHADIAMYRAKTEGRGQYRFFEREMDEKLKLHMQLEAELAEAIASGQIVPFYQQLVDLSSEKIIGCEVLARWRHPVHGIISPDIFIPIAEDTGIITSLTVSILRQAIEDAKHWPDDYFLSVNLSPRQLADPWIAQEILAILSKSGFAPHRLEIEITESGLVERVDDVKDVLKSLRNVGVRIALDDFGTGYSGLYHLRQLCIDTIKIDRSFVTHMLSSEEEEKIVEAVINLSNSMGMSTIAEGVETAEVRRRLIELGCKAGQGYYFGKPQDAAETRAAISGSTKSGKMTA